MFSPKELVLMWISKKGPVDPQVIKAYHVEAVKICAQLEELEPSPGNPFDDEGEEGEG